MPYTIRTQGRCFEMRSPHGVKAHCTTQAKAEAQRRLLQAKEHAPSFRPRGR